MNVHTVSVDTASATAIVRAVLRRPLNVTATRPLHGGMVNAVYEWATDGEPARIVAKLSSKTGNVFEHECGMLRWYRQHTRFPVPEPYGCLADERVFRGSVLLMQRMPGCNLAEAQLTRAGMRHFQHDLAGHVASLHEHRSDTYGSALVAQLSKLRYARWLDWFAPKLEYNYQTARPRLSPRARDVTARLLARLDDWLPECHSPTLVHGDLWATNIIVDDNDADPPVITAFVDGAALYCDPEYELAYLRVFHTANSDFFDRYCEHHALREGFERRCRVYWLNTLLLHVWHFGMEYAPRTESLAAEIGRLDA